MYSNRSNLNGSTPNTGPDYTYLWTTANGNIVSDDTTLAPTVDASGLYILSVTDLINGCVGTDSVVTVDANTPNAGRWTKYGYYLYRVNSNPRWNRLIKC